MGLPEKYSEGYVTKPPVEDPTFGERISLHMDALKSSFAALSKPEQIALICAGVLIVGILIYVLTSVTTLLSIRTGGVKTYQSARQNQTVVPQPQASSDGKLPTDANSETGSIPANGTVATAPQQNEASGIGGVVQNIISNISGTTSGVSSQTTSTSKSQNGTAAQSYIVNFLNGLLYFEDPQTGQVSPYIITNVNPSSFIWETYVSDTDGYSIEYPKNWTVVKYAEGGHEGVVIYPLSEDPENKDAKRIGFGWSPYYLLPTTQSTSIYYQIPITLSNTLGQLYTLGGGEGDKKGIAVLLPHRFGYVAVGGSAETDELLYVFQHMLGTLTLVKN